MRNKTCPRLRCNYQRAQTLVLDFLAPVFSLLLGPGATPLSAPCQISIPVNGDGGKDEEAIRDSVRIRVRSGAHRLRRPDAEGHNPERLGERCRVRCPW